MKTKRTRTLHARLWKYFVIFAAAIALVIWLLQFFSFDRMYYQKEIDKIESIGETVAHEWRNVKFSQPVSIEFYRNEVPVHIFNSKGARQGSLVLQISDPNPLNARDFIRRYEESGQQHYIDNIKDPMVPNTNFVVYGTKILNEDSPEDSLYIFIVNPMGPLETVRNILRDNLFIILVTMVAMAILISYFMAKRIAEPLVKMTEKTEQLAEGSYDVVFEESNIQEIDKLSRTLNHAASELAKIDQEKRNFLATISHDLRTPLASIKAYAELIRDISGHNPVKREEHIQVIVREADWMSAMISEILEYSRIQSGSINYEMSDFSLCGLTEGVVKKFQESECVLKNLEIRVEAEDDMYAFGDMSRIQRVIHNFVSNAIRHSPENGTVEIFIKRSGSRIRWEIQDHGPGISKEDQMLIWERYFTKTKDYDRSNGGVGLGLSIVKGILKAHGSPFGVESEEGKGAMFWFEIDSAKSEY